MLIHCPNCDTAYNINKEDLAQSGGQVVCCRCDEIFEAEIYKVPDDAELLDDTMLDSAITRGVGADWQPDLSLFENIDNKKKDEIINSDRIIELTSENPLSTEEENNNKSALELASEIIEDISFNGSLENPTEDEMNDPPLSFPSIDELDDPEPNNEAEIVEDDDFTNPDIDDLAGLLGDEPEIENSPLDNFATPPPPISEFKEFEPNNFNFAATTESENNPSELSDTNKDKDKVTDDINDLLEEFSDVDANTIASELATEKETEENNELSELLDGLSQEVTKKETSFIDETSQLSDLLDSMSGQGLLEEDSALKEEAKQDNMLDQDSDLSQLDFDDDTVDDGVINAVDKIDNPDLRTEPLSYFSDSMMVEDVAFANTEEKGFPWFKLLISCFLFCSLLIQIVWFERHQIIKSPAGRNFAETLCEKLSCQLPQKTDLSKIELIKRYFESDSYIPHALQLKLIIANNAEFEQPYPIIKVDLSNHHNEIIASRYFKPEEYLQNINNKNFMPINTPQTLIFQFEDTKRKASGFHITFY